MDLRRSTVDRNFTCFNSMAGGRNGPPTCGTFQKARQRLYHFRVADYRICCRSLCDSSRTRLHKTKEFLFSALKIACPSLEYLPRRGYHHKSELDVFISLCRGSCKADRCPNIIRARLFYLLYHIVFRYSYLLSVK